MELPVININPVHKIHLPVLDKDIHFKPYTVEQEKLFLTALSDNKTSEVITNFIEILKMNIEDEIDFSNLSVIDFITIVIYIRAKSKGEVFTLEKSECSECKKKYSFEVNFEDCIKYANEDTKSKTITLTDKLAVDIQPVNFNLLYTLDNDDTETSNEVKQYNLLIDTAIYSIKKIIFNETIFNNLTYEDIKEKFINNLTEHQLKQIFDASQDMISMNLEINSVCPHCAKEDKTLVNNFLSLLG